MWDILDLSLSYFCSMQHLSTRSLFFENLALTSDFPMELEIESASGFYLYAPDGKRYADLISGISVSNLGHQHPAVKKAIHDQTEKFLHLMVYGEYIQAPQVAYAALLASTLPPPLSSVYFTNSGAEAIDGAMKLVKRATGRTGLISCYNAYHGSTQGPLSLMGCEHYKQAFRPLLPGTTHIRFNNTDDLSMITTDTAGVFIEAVQAEAGCIVPDTDYMIALSERCRQTGTLLVIDEIQSGMGRTGKTWAFEHFGILPDVVCTAKSLGGGLPLGAFIGSSYLMQQLRRNPILGHMTTFGGNALCCAAGMACLQTILDENLASHALQLETLVRNELSHPSVNAITGKGLLLCAHVNDNPTALRIIREGFQLGIVTDWFLFCDNALRIAPPLNTTEEELSAALLLLRKAMDLAG
jgi:acetylornithine/succinyldiaminopimelate/putrescine aminotransferase